MGAEGQARTRREQATSEEIMSELWDYPILGKTQYEVIQSHATFLCRKLHKLPRKCKGTHAVRKLPDRGVPFPFVNSILAHDTSGHVFNAS